MEQLQINGSSRIQSQIKKKYTFNIEQITDGDKHIPFEIGPFNSSYEELKIYIENYQKFPDESISFHLEIESNGWFKPTMRMFCEEAKLFHFMELIKMLYSFNEINDIEALDFEKLNLRNGKKWSWDLSPSKSIREKLLNIEVLESLR